MKKFLSNKKGFTLTEVVIGIMILTVAITAATNLLVGLNRSNEANLRTMQAYYYAVEGLEMVRNVRDSNWLHNRDWMSGGSSDIWGSGFEIGKEYGISFAGGGFAPAVDGEFGENTLKLARPFDVVLGEMAVSNVDGEATGFKRSLSFEEFEGRDSGEAVLVKSLVVFELRGEQREVSVSTVLTNWKDGLF